LSCTRNPSGRQPNRFLLQDKDRLQHRGNQGLGRQLIRVGNGCRILLAGLPGFAPFDQVALEHFFKGLLDIDRDKINFILAAFQG
jgi:hypothetical protein